MKITKEWLVKQGACEAGIDWFESNEITDAKKIIQYFIKKKEHLDWANWLIVRVMSYKQYVSYAVFAAEQVIAGYEEKYPNDNRPRAAIEAAKKCIKNPTKANKNAAYAAACAAHAAYAAAYSAYSADSAYAAHSAYAAAYSAHAAHTAHAAHAADSTHAAHAAHAADNAAMRIKILKYGLRFNLRGTE